MADERILASLRDGEIELLGLMPDASNYTFAAVVRSAAGELPAVYKPRAGEQPLWDFPGGTLYQREVAAYLLSEALGWGLVPPTVVAHGPHGVGSLQLFVDHDPEHHYLTLMPDHADGFRLVAVLDVVMNNADRKSGHCLLDRRTGRIAVVDHGVCFHVDPKLRTVIWDFAGEPLPDAAVSGLQRFLGQADIFGDLLTPAEVDATRERARVLLQRSVFPSVPDDRRAIPWPPV